MLRETVNEKINKIESSLSNIYLKDISLLYGNSGIALFELYLSKIQNNEKLKRKATNRIEKTFSEFENIVDIQFSYCFGLRLWVVS